MTLDNIYVDSIKDWTILIYADGNNEMEEVIYKSLLACENIGSSNEINVVVEIGKLGNCKTNYENSWTGVRRYYASNGGSILIEDLGKINMADPNILYDFIKWGWENYKARHLMLVLSDHGGDFVGCFTDLSLSVPYIMGIPEMIEAINETKNNSEFTIDILVLDMCYMNCIEIIYELSQEENPTVKTLVTYMDNAAYEGINYNKLISTTEKLSNITDMHLFIKNFIDSQDYNMIAYEINHERLEEIKLLFNDIAKTAETPLAALNNLSVKGEKSDFLDNINDKLKSIVIYSKKAFHGINESINIIYEDVGHLIYFYEKLAFAKNNHWKVLLNKMTVYEEYVKKDRVNVSLSGTSESKIHYILKFNGCKGKNEK